MIGFVIIGIVIVIGIVSEIVIGIMVVIVIEIVIEIIVIIVIMIGVFVLLMILIIMIVSVVYVRRIGNVFIVGEYLSVMLMSCYMVMSGLVFYLDVCVLKKMIMIEGFFGR